VVEARRAAVRIAEHAGISCAEIKAALSTTSSTVRRLRAAPVEPALAAAVTRRLALEQLVAGLTTTTTALSVPNLRW
jgi:hypothetical protein